jgi:hypothetical protein
VSNGGGGHPGQQSPGEEPGGRESRPGSGSAGKALRLTGILTRGEGNRFREEPDLPGINRKVSPPAASRSGAVTSGAFGNDSVWYI